MLILLAVWLVVGGYTVLYVGQQGFAGRSVTFKEAFFGSPS